MWSQTLLHNFIWRSYIILGCNVMNVGIGLNLLYSWVWDKFISHKIPADITQWQIVIYYWRPVSDFHYSNFAQYLSFIQIIVKGQLNKITPIKPSTHKKYIWPPPCFIRSRSYPISPATSMALALVYLIASRMAWWGWVDLEVVYERCNDFPL